MNDSLLHLLNEIKEERQNRRRPLPTQPPGALVVIEALRRRAELELHYSIPVIYTELLSLTDGIDSSGVMLYASHSQPLAGHADRLDYIIEGFIEANMLWRAGVDGAINRDYIYFAESGDYLYCHHLQTEEFQIVDRVTLEPIYKPAVFNTLEELIEQIFNHMLGRYGINEEDSI